MGWFNETIKNIKTTEVRVVSLTIRDTTTGITELVTWNHEVTGDREVDSKVSIELLYKHSKIMADGKEEVKDYFGTSYSKTNILKSFMNEAIHNGTSALLNAMTSNESDQEFKDTLNKHKENFKQKQEVLYDTIPHFETAVFISKDGRYIETLISSSLID